ncbi:GGDEF domain-containing protein, partial [Myxococcota bacterium]|nr:GGDEF domain-containing protein [Myxococcota bacterium]MBU1509806.1 GGDEF domain-containing protein [Myxococcota bacterium]
QALTLLAGICAPQLEIARLSRLATVDPLTGALNRRGMEHLMTAAVPEATAAVPSAQDAVPSAQDAVPSAQDAVPSAQDAARPLSVIMADIDHFKRVNDTYGHLMGDQVLKQVATILASVVRAGDAVIRYGGEEFLIVLTGVASERALAIAERARQTIEATEFRFHEISFHTTISMGVAQLRPGESREELIKRADEALYAAKNDGRNRSVVAVDGPESGISPP